MSPRHALPAALLCAAGLFLAPFPAPAQDESAPKLKPRPELSAGDYDKQVKELRAAYAKPATEWPKATLDDSVKASELGPLPEVTYPRDNPHSEAKAELGKVLFFDPRLSGSRQIACASCHDPDLAWADGRTVSFGHDRKPLRRNSPALLNVTFNTAYFWDGRAASLEDQALAVLLNPDELRSGEKDVAEQLRSSKGYRVLFRAAFGDEDVTLARVGKAIATFERGLVGGRSKFDTFLKGKTDSLTDHELRGLHLFRTDARCLHCHNGPNFTDNQFHEVGLSYYSREMEDLGRFRHTKDAKDVGKFKTPSLRNVGRTAPYMHNGLFELSGVLNMYNAGMPTLRRTKDQKDDPKFPTKSPLLKPLNLNKTDLRDLEAFLQTLTEPKRRVRPPELPALGDAK